MRAMEIAITMMADGKTIALKDTPAEKTGKQITILYTDMDNEKAMLDIRKAFSDYQVIMTVVSQEEWKSKVEQFPTIEMLDSLSCIGQSSLDRVSTDNPNSNIGMLIPSLLKSIDKQWVMKKVPNSSTDSPWRSKNKPERRYR